MCRHMSRLADTISLDLTYFSNKFIENSFINPNAVSGILSKQGVSDGDKSRKLLDTVRQNYKICLEKHLEWTIKFIGIFSCEAAYSDLAALLRKEAFPKGTDAFS